MTLVGQGLTLSGLIRRLGVAADDTAEREETQARLAVAQAARQRLAVPVGTDNMPAGLLDDLHRHYQQRIAGLEARHNARPGRTGTATLHTFNPLVTAT